MTEQEKAAIEHLKQEHDPSWNQLIEAFTSLLHRRLLELAGNQEKAEDYMQDSLFPSSESNGEDSVAL